MLVAKNWFIPLSLASVSESEEFLTELSDTEQAALDKQILQCRNHGSITFGGTPEDLERCCVREGISWGDWRFEQKE